jgi:hypothetical protein
MCGGWYMLPYLLAESHKHPHAPAIGALNLFLGWTLLGWVVALAWASAKPGEARSASPAIVSHRSS